MLHPDTEVKFINKQIGDGIVSTQDIPKGTIICVRDALDIEIPLENPLWHDPRYQHILKTYAYKMSDDTYILEWDNTKYMNHSCNSNTLSIPIQSDIAIRDIHIGEEITEDYGRYGIDEFCCACGDSQCRNMITPADIETYAAFWARRIKAALPQLNQVPQPLFTFIDEDVYEQFMNSVNADTSY